MRIAGEGKTKSERVSQLLGILAMIAVLLFALLLAGTSLFASARINPVDYSLLKIELLQENPWINALVAVVGVGAMILIGKLPVTKRTNLVLGLVVLALLGLFGVAWIHSVKAMAESDGDALILIAEKILAGNYTDLVTPGVFDHVYLAQSPYQFGLLAYLQVFVALFGATDALTILRLVNVGLLISSYGALLLTTQRLFRDDRVTFVTILLLCVCIQPVLNCTLVYGIVPAFAFGVWALYFTVRYLQDEKKRNMIPVTLLLAAAVFVRTTSWLLVIAICIVLVLHALRRWKISPILILIALVLFVSPWTKIAQSAYEQKIGADFGPGYPKTFWIAMCLQEGWKGPGWHVKEYQTTMRDTYGDDAAGVGEQAKEDIAIKFKEFAAEPEKALDYYYKKLVTMWNEPTFTSIWISKSVTTYAEPTALAKFVYSDSFDEAFRLVMKKAIVVVYTGFALSAVFLLRKRDEVRLLLPVSILGGLLFHLIVEAKSQYVLEYLPLLLPLAAYGAISLGDKAPFARKKTPEAGTPPEGEAPGPDAPA